MKVSAVPELSLQVECVTVEGGLETREFREPRKYRQFWQSKSVGRRELLSGLVFKVFTDRRVYWFEAEAGFRTNYYSYPLRSRSLLGQNEAAVGHDWLYYQPVVWSLIGRAHRIDRETADAIFLALMDRVGTVKLLRQIRHLGVRIGGESSWERCRATDDQKTITPYRTWP